MKTGTVLSLCGLALLWSGRSAHGVADFLLIWSGIAFLIVGVAFLLSAPRLFAKRANGRLSPVSYVLGGPYHLINYILLLFSRVFSREEAFHEIIPGLYLGGRLLPRHQSRTQALGIKSVLDLTCEFSEVGFLRKTNYLCIPLLDRTAPTLDQLKLGIQFVKDGLASGPVYVHCALGHGRSATFVVGYLMVAGIEPILENALRQVLAKRPRVKLHPGQRRILEMLKP